MSNLYTFIQGVLEIKIPTAHGKLEIVFRPFH